MRAFLVRLHRYVGLAMAGFLAIAGLTGSAIAFKPELDAWLNPELFQLPHQYNARLPPSEIARRIEAADARAEALSVVYRPSPKDSVLVVAAAKPGMSKLGYNHVFIDPYTGAILGRRQSGDLRLDRAHLMPFLHEFHHTLSLPGIWGLWLMGAVSLAWVIDCFVGFYLTLPRGRPFWKKWRPIWTIKSGAGSYRFNLDLHRASGLWAWPVLLLLAVSSVALNLNGEVFRPVLSALLPMDPSMWERPIPTKRPLMALDFNQAMKAAEGEASRRGWKRPVSIVYAIRHRGIYSVRFGYEHEPGFGTATVYLSGMTGEILETRGGGGDAAGDVVDDLMLPIHSGNVGGLPGRVFICIAGLAVAVLSITGVLVWWKKRTARIRRNVGTPVRRGTTGLPPVPISPDSRPC